MNANELFDKHAPQRKLNKHKISLKDKPWITPAIQKPCLIKNTLFKKDIKLSDPLIKQKVHFKQQYYRNLLPTVSKKSKQSYYEEFFQNNLNESKNMWKGIRNLIPSSPKSNIQLLSDNSEAITGPEKIANIFNGQFSTIAKETKAKIKLSNKSFADFRHLPFRDLFFH